MPRCDFTVLCRSVTVDPFDNGISLHHLAENISVYIPEERPTPTADEANNISLSDGLVLASVLQRSVTDVPEDLKGRITIVLPNGNPVNGPEFPIDLKTSSTARTLIQISALPYASGGEYRFQLHGLLETGWSVLGEYRALITVTRSRTDSE